MFILGVCDSIPPQITSLVSTIINIIKIGIPIALIIWGMLDLGKAVMAQNEDEIKKAQQVFIKRIISAVLVFLVVAIVQLVMGLLGEGDSEAWSCACQLIGGCK